MFARLSKISATLFISMVMAMGMLALLWYYQPQWFSWIQDGADLIEDAIAGIPLQDRYNNIVRLFASDDKIVLLIFTVISRIILAILGTAFTALTASAKVRLKAPGLLAQVSSMVSTLFLAFVLAILMLAIIALTMEGLLHSLLDMADWVEDQLSHLPIGGRFRSAVRYVVSDDKIVLLFFTIIARLLIAVAATSAGAAWRSATGGSRHRLEMA